MSAIAETLHNTCTLRICRRLYCKQIWKFISVSAEKIQMTYTYSTVSE